MIEAGFLTAVGVIWILCRFDLRKVAGMATFIDIAAFVLLPVLFIGTFAGMVTGMLAGVLISLFLTIIRRSVTAVTPRVVRFEGDILPRLVWVSK